MNPPKFMLEMRELELRSIAKGAVAILLGGILDKLRGKKTGSTLSGMRIIMVECQIYLTRLKKDGVDLYSDFWGW